MTPLITHLDEPFNKKFKKFVITCNIASEYGKASLLGRMHVRKKILPLPLAQCYIS